MKSKLFMLGLLFLNVVANAQVAVTNTGTLYIKTNTDIFYAAGNFTNTSSAALTNNGSLYINGNITNDQASMAAGSGTLILNVKGLQTISGGQSFKVFNLNTDNAAGIQLNANLSISGAHSFSSGVITTSSTPNYLIYESGSSYTGASDAKHVNGWVKKIGTTNFTFPTGNGVYLRQIDLKNLSAASEFNVKYNGPTYNPSSVQHPIASMNAGEHWIIDQIAGGNAQVQLNWDSSKVPFPNYVVSDLRAAVYSGTDWTNAGGSASGSVATTGTITSNSLSSFGRFAIGSVSYPLPLRFITFSAVKETASIHLKWQTANEENVENYEVQRSSEGNAFVTIGSLKAANKDQQWYQFLDATVPSSKLYYRIKANDVDGKTTYTKVIVVTADNIQKIQVLSNPVKDMIQLTTQNMPRSLYTYQLLNSAGQVYKKGNFACEGSSLITLPVDYISPGYYNLLITNGKEQKQFGLLVQ
jgi:hypothetical protein